MKYILIMLMAFCIQTVQAADVPATPHDGMKLAKKKDHSKKQTPKTKKPKHIYKK
jgi:hypothetical protein